MGNFEQWKQLIIKVIGFIGIGIGLAGTIPAEKWTELMNAVSAGNWQVALGSAIAIGTIVYGWWKNNRTNIVAAAAEVRPDVAMVVPTTKEANKLPANVISEEQQASIIEHTAAAAASDGRRT